MTWLGRVAICLCLGGLAACSGAVFPTEPGQETPSAETGVKGGLFAGFLNSPGAKSSAVKAGKPPLTSASMARGAVVIRAPSGYCIDSATLSRKQGGFALLASCDVLTGAQGAHFVLPAVMTVSIGPASPGAVAPVAQDFATSLQKMDVLAVQTKGELILAHLGKGGDQVIKAGDPKHWRGAFTINNRLIGIAAYGVKGSAAAGPEGANLIAALAGSIRKASPVRRSPKKGTRIDKVEAKEPQAGKGLRASLQNLFN